MTLSIVLDIVHYISLKGKYIEAVDRFSQYITQLSMLTVAVHKKGSGRGDNFAGRVIIMNLAQSKDAHCDKPVMIHGKCDEIVQMATPVDKSRMCFNYIPTTLQTDKKCSIDVNGSSGKITVTV